MASVCRLKLRLHKIFEQLAYKEDVRLKLAKESNFVCSQQGTSAVILLLLK